MASERHHEAARGIAHRFGGKAIELSAVPAALPGVDIVIAATSVKEPVIRRDHLAAAMPLRQSRPIFLVDLGVPRNIEAGAGDLPGVYLYDLDDLKGVADGNLKRREEWIAPARRIVDTEVEATGAWLASLEAVPVIRDLERFGETCRQEVLGRASRRVRDLPPESREEIEYLTKALVAKLLHQPIRRLKELPGPARYADIVRRLFGLE